MTYDDPEQFHRELIENARRAAERDRQHLPPHERMLAEAAEAGRSPHD